MDCRVRIGLVPRIDLAFRAVLADACLAASLTGVGLDTPDAARIAEDELRSNGYPDAEIDLYRSVDEYRNHVANWIVWRDGRAAAPRDGARIGKGAFGTAGVDVAARRLGPLLTEPQR